jgi:hypothetical protein
MGKQLIENKEYFSMATRIIRAAGFRAGNGDEYDLAALLHLESSVFEATCQAIALQLQNGRSWAFIGASFGVSRQAAFRRFASRVSEIMRVIGN